MIASPLRPLVVIALLLSLAPLPASSVTAQRPVHVDPLRLAQYAGQYLLSPTYVLTVFTEQDRLYVRAPGRGSRLLVPDFFYRDRNARISFRVSGGTVEGLVLHQGGAELEMRRMD